VPKNAKHNFPIHKKPQSIIVIAVNNSNDDDDDDNSNNNNILTKVILLLNKNSFMEVKFQALTSATNGGESLGSRFGHFTPVINVRVHDG
jgi:hypothetical protein